MSKLTAISTVGTTVTVSFNAQATAGTYRMTIGPQVPDLAGNLMDQDRDGTVGEALDDSFTASVTLVNRPPHQNPIVSFDVNADGIVSPIDVLLIINDLNFNGSRILPINLPVPPYLDVNGNRSVDPLDVLEIINFINNTGSAGVGGGEGEGATEKLGYSKEDVMMISTKEIIRISQEVERKLHIIRQLDSAVVEFNDSPNYGPLLASLNDDKESDDSLEDYLASWTSFKSKKSEKAMDSVFADEYWM